MARLKNYRHELFVREYMKTRVGAEAYRRVYPQAHPLTTARICASQLLTRPNVRRRLEELEERAMKRSDITFEKILTDYQWALEAAKSQAKAGEVVAAASAQAKLVGLIVDRREIGTAGDFEGLNDIDAIIAKVKEDIGPEAAAAMAKAFDRPQEIKADQSLQALEPPIDTLQ